jgi:hypothetical protein
MRPATLVLLTAVGLSVIGFASSGCAKTLKDVAPVFTQAGWHNILLTKDNGEPVTKYSLWINEVNGDHTSAQHYAQNMAPHPVKLRICLVPNLRLLKYEWSMVIRETNEDRTITDGKVLDSYKGLQYTRIYGNTYDCWTTKMLPATRYRVKVTDFHYWEVK